MDILLIVVLGILGALFGSFACAQVWRLRARQLVEDKRLGEPVDEKELRRLQRLVRPPLRDRSECLSCRHQLAWYDLIPVVSWVSLWGKCRYCHKPIGTTEVFVEIGLAIVFIVSYMAWPYQLTSMSGISLFSIWLIACVVMTILFVYDAKWSLLPFVLTCTLIVIGLLFQVLVFASTGQIHLWSLIVAIILLGGLYLLFSLFGWVGMGDGILGVGLALFLGDWQYAFLALFLANLFGCVMLIPLALQRKLHRKVRIPFGPFLIVGMMTALLFGQGIIQDLFGPMGYLEYMLML